MPVLPSILKLHFSLSFTVHVQELVLYYSDNLLLFKRRRLGAVQSKKDVHFPKIRNAECAVKILQQGDTKS